MAYGEMYKRIETKRVQIQMKRAENRECNESKDLKLEE